MALIERPQRQVPVCEQVALGSTRDPCRRMFSTRFINKNETLSQCHFQFCELFP